MLKTEREQNNEQNKPMDNERKAKAEQEGTKLDETPTKPMFDEKGLNYLENKAYFLANVGTLKEFNSLSEEIKTLSPDLFKKQFPKVVKEKVEKLKDSETPTEKTTKAIDEKYQQRKNELINKVTFIVNKCGTSSDFEKLSDDVRTMDPLLFKEKSKDCRF
jgi:hypothetical protein